MATKFLEPGGDATFNVAATNAGGLWSSVSGVSLASDFVHGGHLRSIKFNTGVNSFVFAPASIMSNAGTRISFYIYMNALPGATTQFFDNQSPWNVRITSGGILQMYNAVPTQLGINGTHTLSAGRWYRISLAYTITDTTTNRFELFVDGDSDISITNATLTSATTGGLVIGNRGSDATFDLRVSDIYVDDSSSLTDTGDVWVTAKRPNANGTANELTTQVGAGGSGYGSGHSPQVNERALSTTNGWSVVAPGSTTTEEYTIESASTGDIDISGTTIVDYVGWVSVGRDAADLASGTIIVGGTTFSISYTTTATVIFKVKGSSTYPAGNTDIGVTVSGGTAATCALYECGILVAYIPVPLFVQSLNPIKQGVKIV